MFLHYLRSSYALSYLLNFPLFFLKTVFTLVIGNYQIKQRNYFNFYNKVICSGNL